jgi:hypothetical protein
MKKTMKEYNEERSNIRVFNLTKERFDKYTRTLNKTHDEMLNDLLDSYTELMRMKILKKEK